MIKKALPNVLPPAAAYAVIIAVALWATAQSDGNILAHSPYDSYTLQAMAWRHGHIALDHNYEWLELAVYKGQYWVSFPPLPAIPMLVLSFFFGDNTPSGAATFVYYLGGLGALYALLRRYLPADQSSLWLVFIALGGTVMSLAVAGGGAIGGVWFQAQLLAFLLTSLAFLLIDGSSKRGWALALTFLALSVACRPFNLIYFPALIWLLLGHLGHDRRAALRYLAWPAAVGVVIGAYNAARFGSPLEFGHRWLPELTRSGEGMFLPRLIPNHLQAVLTAPTIHDGKLEFMPSGGFAIYLTNPMLVIGLVVVLVRAIRRRVEVIDLILFVTILVHIAMLLSHRTNGGWQYGTRYMCDVIPAATYLVARAGVRVTPTRAMVMGAVMLFNIYALTVFFATAP